MSFGPWDAALIVVVSLHATAIAYVRQPRWKAILLMPPTTFTFATLSLGQPVGVTHLLGLPLLMGYAAGVYWLKRVVGLPIVLAIAASALGYCVVAAAVASGVKSTELGFWIAFIATAALAELCRRRLEARPEPGHRTPLPVWVKLPILVAVICSLVAIKQRLGGFFSCFPMVGVVACYEARHSLWSILRQFPTLMLVLLPMLAVCRLTQPSFGIGMALVFGWITFAAALGAYLLACVSAEVPSSTVEQPGIRL